MMRIRATVLRFSTLLIGFVGCLDVDSLAKPGANVDASDSGSDDATLDAPVASYDAGDGATFDVAPTSFIILLDPWHVTLDPGDSTDVHVNVVRGSSFADTVDVTVQDLGGSLSANPTSITIPSSSSQGTFTLKADPSAASPLDVTSSVLAISKRDTSITAQTTLGVHVGSFLVATSTNQSVQLPSWATSVLVKVWGAGGGGGGAKQAQDGLATGGPGGGGGFVSAVIPTDPALPLDLVVGTGGAPGSPDPATPIANGGGGGGYSAVSQSGVMLVVAGAGGGGVSGQGANSSGHCGFGSAASSNPALGGGGGNAELSQKTPERSATTSGPGTALPDGGGTSGAQFQGGNATAPAVAGGIPGGGQGGTSDNFCLGGGVGGGGGGGGRFGGAGGEGHVQYDWENIQGGGGGSGMVVASASNVVQTAGVQWQTAGKTDPDYAPGAGLGGAALVGDAGALPGAPGRIVVRFVKR